MQGNKVLMILSLFVGALAGCTPASAPPAGQPVESPTILPTVTPALPTGWETYSSDGQCGYTISHPSDMDGVSQGVYNWLLSPTAADPGGPVPSFMYISVIPDDLAQDAEPGTIYNYDLAETQALLNLPVGESLSLREDPSFAAWFTYTRLPDVVLSSQTARAYENAQPWEFPPGTKEIRYYLQVNDCTYMVGGYLASADSDQMGAIDEELFDQIIATFRLAPE